jgi:hypothetical protein
VWGGEKYHLVKSAKKCRSKKKGDLGIKNLRMMNISLLCIWWWNLENNEGLWQDIVKIKYVRNTPISLIKCRQSDSPMWGDLRKVRHIYLQDREFKINSGRLVSF